MREKFNQVLTDVESHFSTFRLSEALLALYGFIWDDFCSWYLEMIKPGYEKPIDRATYEATLDLYADLMVALHPFMPFITEEIWHQLRTRAAGDDCMMQTYPKAGTWDEALIRQVESAKDVITKVRELRNQNQIKPREALHASVQNSGSAKALFAREGLLEMVQKLAVLATLDLRDDEPANSKSFVSGTEKYYVEINQEIDVEAERAKIQQELEYQRGFLKSIEAKLSNERFVAGAPAAVVENERQKQADALARIGILEESLAGFRH
jgi:valyl-tRNA synthetase